MVQLLKNFQVQILQKLFQFFIVIEIIINRKYHNNLVIECLNILFTCAL